MQVRLQVPLGRHAVAAMLGSAALVLTIVPIRAVSARTSHPVTTAAKPTIVLVHGDWADGSSWGHVSRRLQADGYTVLVPPNPLRGPGDAEYIASFLASASGPIVLVAHSYGGFVITNAARGNTNVK